MNRKNYYDKLRKWEAEGYDVSELREKWFPARRGRGGSHMGKGFPWWGSIVIVLVVVGIALGIWTGVAGHFPPWDKPAPAPALVADFTIIRPSSPSQGSPLEVVFNDQSTGSITGWLWDFGDGSTSSDRNTFHTYAREGNYPVKLTVTGPGGSDTRTLNVDTLLREVCLTLSINGPDRCGVRLDYFQGRSESYTFPTTGIFYVGTSVSLTAIPVTSRFTSWSGDATGTNPTIAITMNSDKNIIANFVATGNGQYNLLTSVSPSGSGSVSPSSSTYDAGATVHLTARPTSGYQFSHWSGDATDTSPTITITMDRDKNVIANFIKLSRSLWTETRT